MMLKIKSYLKWVILGNLFILLLCAFDWPIYKGNIYYTGNNDEVTVKNNNLKWLYQADEMVYNPIVSDGRIYFLDIKKRVYCVNEETGKLLWKIDLNKISSRFTAYSRAMGKVKYPLIKGESLFLTDNIAIYSINKKTGDINWARTGMQDEKKFEDLFRAKREKEEKSDPLKNRYRWQPGRSSTAMVDGIYSDPVINEDLIYYGTRNIFISRDIRDGHLKWNNRDIKTYSGFPSFYDKYIFTQSMDYAENKFTLYCLLAETGDVQWKRTISKPFKIFSPVVYQRRIYFASGESIYCFDLNNGDLLWEKSYGEIITSNPSFTEREILFTLGNKKIISIDPLKGDVRTSIDPGTGAAPYYVTIRDQVYIASTFRKTVGSRDLPYASLKAIYLSGRKGQWEFIPPFPGGAQQPAASRGIMFLPAGNYLYAVGTDYYPRVIDGGSANYDPYDRIEPSQKDKEDNKKGQKKEKDNLQDPDKLPLRKMKVTVENKTGNPVSAEVEIKKWHKGKLVYRKKAVVRGMGEIEVPDTESVEITATADGYIPKKVIISRDDGTKKIVVDEIEKGKSIVVENVYFELNEAYLRKESLNILDRMIEAMKRNRRIKLEVRGHTDSTGETAYNQKLSERRSDAVVEYMIKNGISPERVRAKGYGEKEPIASNKTKSGRMKNRRTEFYILDK